MTDLYEETRQRLTVWEQRLQRALYRSSRAAQARIQRQLAELWTRKQTLTQLSREQVRTLHEHLSRDPDEWLASPTPA